MKKRFSKYPFIAGSFSLEGNYTRYYCLLIMLLAVLNVNSQLIEFNSADWENPAVFEKGQNAPHSFFIPYSSKEEALKVDKENRENFLLLNGVWKFMWVERPELVPEGFWEPNFDVSGWADIKVPSNWQMEGFGHPKFRNIALTFESDPPNIPDYYNPAGCYKSKFNIPYGWQNKEVMLRFEGVKSASYVWINGQAAGYNQGGFEPAEYNITDYIQQGENDLAVQVIRFSDGSYLENQDMWRLSGIFRDVKLYAHPKVFIRDFYVVTDLDRNYRNSDLKVELDVENAGRRKVTCCVSIDVLDSHLHSILNNEIRSVNFNIDKDSLKKITLTTIIENPQKWSAEYPNLYTLLCELKDENGNTVEAFTHRLGFREVEMINNVITINGVPVKFNGVNSHMHHPRYGQAVPYETLKEDMLIMKRFNINCVRTCHYPPSPEYIDLADELGIYIFDEVGDEAHANINLSEDPVWIDMYRDRSRKLVYRDRNHPSVVVWSAGNESGSGENIKAVIETGKAIDPSRKAWMYGGNSFYIPFEDIIGPRYWIPYKLKLLAEGKVLPGNDLRPSFMDEYIAATGNGLGGMDEYWQLIRKYPRLSGGAIWDWISPGIKTPLWIIPDLSPLKNDGAIMGRPVFAEGGKGRGLQFSGHDDWVEFYRDPSLDITGNQLSVSFWIKPYEIPQPNTFITKGGFQYGIVMSDTQNLEFYIYSDKRISVSATVGAEWYGRWHHIAGIYDGKCLRLFIDGELAGRTEFTGNISHTPFPLCIGRQADIHDQGEFSGRMSSMIIDEVKIFNKAVSLAKLNSEKSDDAVLYIDFENDKKKGDFFAVGLGGRTYGIVWPDRRIQPEIYQIKKSGQPVDIEAVKVEEGLIRISNRHHFKNLNELAGKWEISVDGKVIQNGNFETDLPAGESKEVQIPYKKLDEILSSCNNPECFLLISFELKDPALWADTGHEIAWEQFKLPVSFSPGKKIEGAGNIDVNESPLAIIIKGSNFNYEINKATGQFTSLIYNGTEYLEQGPEFTVWRPPLANDIDPWGSHNFNQRNFTPGLGRSIDNQLRTLGLDKLRPTVDEVSVEPLPGSRIIIRLSCYSRSSRDSLLIENSRRKPSAIQRNEVWTILSDGTIEMDQEIIPHGVMPDMFPKIGLRFQLPKAFSVIEWYGRGPFETYPDRKTGAKIGVYHSNAEDMYEPYIIPQDYGNRTDVRWLKIKNNDGKGLMIESEGLFNFSLHKFSTENLSRAIYTYQLNETAYNTRNIDYEVSGVGGTANRQLQKYRIMPGCRKYKLKISPF